MSDDQPSRARRLLQSIRKEIPEALAEGQDHDDAEVAATLRELGIALVVQVGTVAYEVDRQADDAV